MVSPTSLTLTVNSSGKSSSFYDFQCIWVTSSDGRAPGSIINSVSYNAVSPRGNWLQPENNGPVSNAPTAPLTICVHFVYSFPPAGVYSGNITVGSPLAPTVVVPVTVVVGNAPAIISGLNGASFLSAFNPSSQFPGVSPGELVSIFGINLGPATPLSLQLDSTGKVSTSLGGVQVFFISRIFGLPDFAAPLTYVSATQINCVVPYELEQLIGQTVGLEVSYLGQTSSNPVYVRAISTASGIFTAIGTGTGQAAALNPDNTPNTTSNPAPAGSIIQVYMTGEGQTSPPGVDGSVTCSNGCATTSQIPKPLLPVTASVGGQPATVTFYGEAPGLVSGVMQVNVLIPPNTPPGTTSLAIHLPSLLTGVQSGVTIAVK